MVVKSDISDTEQNDLWQKRLPDFEEVLKEEFQVDGHADLLQMFVTHTDRLRVVCVEQTFDTAWMVLARVLSTEEKYTNRIYFNDVDGFWYVRRRDVLKLDTADGLKTQYMEALLDLKKLTNKAGDPLYKKNSPEQLSGFKVTITKNVFLPVQRIAKPDLPSFKVGDRVQYNGAEFGEITGVDSKKIDDHHHLKLMINRIEWKRNGKLVMEATTLLKPLQQMRDEVKVLHEFMEGWVGWICYAHPLSGILNVDFNGGPQFTAQDRDTEFLFEGVCITQQQYGSIEVSADSGIPQCETCQSLMVPHHIPEHWEGTCDIKGSGCAWNENNFTDEHGKYPYKTELNDEGEKIYVNLVTSKPHVIDGKGYVCLYSECDRRTVCCEPCNPRAMEARGSDDRKLDELERAAALKMANMQWRAFSRTKRLDSVQARRMRKLRAWLKQFPSKQDVNGKWVRCEGNDEHQQMESAWRRQQEMESDWQQMESDWQPLTAENCKQGARVRVVRACDGRRHVPDGSSGTTTFAVVKLTAGLVGRIALTDETESHLAIKFDGFGHEHIFLGKGLSNLELRVEPPEGSDDAMGSDDYVMMRGGADDEKDFRLHRDSNQMGGTMLIQTSTVPAAPTLTDTSNVDGHLQADIDDPWIGRECENDCGFKGTHAQVADHELICPNAHLTSSAITDTQDDPIVSGVNGCAMGMWPCGTCTFHNNVILGTCEMCGTPRYVASRSKSM